MEFTQVVQVQAANDMEVGQKVREIKRIAAEPIQGDEAAPPPDGGMTVGGQPTEDEAPEPPAKPVAHLIVGKGEAAPGEEVTIDVLGYSSVPVQGFGAYIGCYPQLELVSGGVTSELLDLVGGEDGVTDIAEQSKRGGIEAFLSLMVAFFGIGGGKVTDTNEIRIPPMTPLMRLMFRVPESAKAGVRYPLDNVSWKYGRIMKGPDGRRKVLRTRNEYGTSKEVAPHGIAPKLVSGWIDVL